MRANIEIPDVDLDGPLAEMTDAAKGIKSVLVQIGCHLDYAAKDYDEILPQVKRLLKLARYCMYAFLALCGVGIIGIGVAVLL